MALISKMRELSELVIVIIFRYEEVIFLEERCHFLRDGRSEIKSEGGDEEHLEEASVRSALRLRSEVKARLLSFIFDELVTNDD